MLSQQIRRGFLNYFKSKGHAVIGSSSVVPHDDPTLLFTNAGMNQFKDVFLGKSHRDYKRATTSQKCIRVGGKHNDLDNVGHTTRHLTFFEMLGNFSFGDYFKEAAIAYAWEVSTQVFAFHENKIWISVYEEDDEAYGYWKKIVPEHRIVRMGQKDNFWAMGDTGPCGPCTELFIDRGDKYGTARSPKEDLSGERYLEYWNLVFMQFNRDVEGKFHPLPKQSIDTGSGLERVVSLKMGVDTVFATDIFQELIAQIEQVSGKQYLNENPAFHVIADHIRSLSFAIADGAQPSNVERGYVLRKLLRRAVRYGRGLGMQEPFLAKVLPRLIDVMGSDYPELIDSKNRIAEILTLEEEAFLRTLKRGGNILNTVIEKALKSPEKQITGEEAFKLKDTYGFPLEEILLIAKDTSLEVNLEEFQLLEERAKEKSRSAQTVHVQEAEKSHYADYIERHGACHFTGYESTSGKGKITALIRNGQFVTSLHAGEQGMVILDHTPFYAEKGGQVGDTGTLTHFTVTNCLSPYPGIIAHIGTCTGTLKLGENVTAAVDAVRRQKIGNNHTATHLFHWALQQVLGPHIRQAGSMVDASRLRFDFSHHKPLSKEELRQIERLVNEKIREDKPIRAYELSYEEAQKRTDIKQFFGDKYGSVVRVIDIDFSKELCGGTHTSSVGKIGFAKIVSEKSIAAGVRRLEAVTGSEAEDLVYAQEEVFQEKLQLAFEETKKAEQQIKTLRRSGLKDLAKGLAHQGKLIAEIVSVAQEDLALLADEVMQLAPHSFLLLATREEGKCHILIRVPPHLIQKGIKAGELIKQITPLIEGNGGGKPDSAQAGGKNPAGLSQAIEKVKTLIIHLC